MVYKKLCVALMMSMLTSCLYAGEYDITINRYDEDSGVDSIQEIQNLMLKIFPRGYVYKWIGYCDFTRLFLLKEHDSLIGIASYRLDPQVSRAAIMDVVAVAKEYRRKGIGSRLVRAIIDDCQLHGIRRLSAEIPAYNASFYERLGFVLNGASEGMVHGTLAIAQKPQKCIVQ